MLNYRRQTHRQRRLLVESLECRRLLAVTTALPSSVTTAGEPPSTGSSVAALVATETDVTAPQIVSVKIGSQAWQSSYLERIDPVQRAGFPMSGLLHQHASLPWNNIDQIKIQFSEDVGGALNDSLVRIGGVQTTDYESKFVVTYDSTAFVATIQFASPLQADRLDIGVLDTLTDAAGNRLDGEWLDGGSQATSGDGIAGGSFHYRINVLPGDLSGDGVVLGNDVTMAVRSRGKSAAADEDFNPLSDLDGSGETTAEEVSSLVRLRGSWLSAIDPTPLELPSVVPDTQPDEPVPISVSHSSDDQLPIDDPLELAEQLPSEMHSQALNSLEISTTTCRALEPSGLAWIAPLSGPQASAVQSSDTSPAELLVYGPLLPNDYRLRFLS
jgi:hypothetical protein